MDADPFNAASVSALLSVVVSTIAAACAYLLARVPDWDDVKPLTWVALTAAVAAGCNFTATLTVPVDVYVWTGRLQVLAIALHVCAWHVYLPGWAGRPLSRRHRAALWVLAGVGFAALVPGLVYADTVTLRPLAWLGVTYHDPAITPTGAVLYGVIGVYGVYGTVLSAVLGRAGAPYPLAHLGCTATILAMALHDALVLAKVPLPTPYLVEFAFYGPITVLGLITLGRVGQSAADLRHLNAGLAGLVARRSSDLERSQQALARAERMAALGQFAAGVAHEVNNPAMVVAANLDYVARELADDPRHQVWTSLRDAQAGVGRIVGLARQLLVAGRSASRPEEPVAPVQLISAVEAAVAATRPPAQVSIDFDVQVPPALHVLAHQESLVQVLANLLDNAVHAIPPGRPGHLSLRAEAAADLVRLEVADDGVGMSEDALLHVFEPFYGHKPAGMGTGLGLAVSLGLVTGMKGRLHIESTLGQGTRAHLELRRAELPPAPLRPADPRNSTTPFRARLLVIDDDPHLLPSLVRMLGRDHDVRAADGVVAGLKAAASAVFDLILCDVMMPSGGAERFWSELPLRAPAALERVVFMTGGAATPEARAFLEAQPRPVLDKPFELEEVQALLAALGPAGQPGPDRVPAPPSAARDAAAPLGRVRRP
jgi:signal transduction histidine kinase/ActR/RegA family two-component response regulator